MEPELLLILYLIGIPAFLVLAGCAFGPDYEERDLVWFGFVSIFWPIIISITILAFVVRGFIWLGQKLARDRE